MHAQLYDQVPTVSTHSAGPERLSETRVGGSGSWCPGGRRVGGRAPACTVYMDMALYMDKALYMDARRGGGRWADVPGECRVSMF